MKADAIQVRSYFAPPVKSHWRWQEACSVVAWSDGPTITFRDELERMLACLAPQGLPPLGSVLLLLAANRDTWDAHPERSKLLHTYLGLHYGGSYADLLQEVITGLARVHNVRHRLRQKPGDLARLAAILFDGVAGRYLPDLSLALVERFREGLVADEVQWKPLSALDDLVHDLGCLRSALRKFDPDRLDLLLGTGLDGVPLPAPLQPPPPTSARSLIGALADDPDLGAVARLARLLLAAVQLPRALSDPDELPIGGVSDIANRGSLDRLLLSELASDDLMLSVRVAMNEALYLRRESPPKAPPHARRVLLDTGLRTWGIPRLFVTAVGLALAAKGDSRQSVELCRAAGDKLAPVDFNSIGGLKEHLAALDHRLHPAAALGQCDLNDVNSDVVLVTTTDTLADGDFRRALHALAPQSLLVAAVDRSGHFELIARSSRGSKVLSRAQFDLDEILAPRPTARKLHDTARDPQLPAIFGEAKFPLRLSCPVDTTRSWFAHPPAVLSLTRDGRLLVWDTRDRGARPIADGLPGGSMLWCLSDWGQSHTVRAVLGSRSQTGLRSIEYNRRTGEVRVMPIRLSDAQPLAVLGRGHVALVLHQTTYDVIDLITGDLIATLDKPAGLIKGQPFYTVTIDNQRYWLELPGAAGGLLDAPTLRRDRSIESAIYQEAHGPRLIAMLRRVGAEGPLGITQLGEIFDPATRHTIRPQKQHLPPALTNIVPPFLFERASHDGQRVWLRCFDRPGSANGVTIELDMITGRLLHVRGTDPGLLEQPMFDAAKPRVLHVRYRAIGFFADSMLVLQSQRGQWWPIMCDPQRQEIRLSGGPVALNASAESFIPRVPFKIMDGFPHRCRLEQAEWPGGSKSWLDPRGLLHLASADRSLPQCTLVLTDGQLAGWLSDGRVFGPEYWLDGQKPTPAADFIRDFFDPFLARLA
jgi:hypothetical protein